MVLYPQQTCVEIMDSFLIQVLVQCPSMRCNMLQLLTLVRRRDHAAGWLHGDSDIGDFGNAEMLSFNWKQKELVPTV